MILLIGKWILLAVIDFEMCGISFWEWSEWLFVKNRPVDTFNAELNKQIH